MAGAVHDASAVERNPKLPNTGEILRTRRHEYEIIRLLGKGGFGAVFECKRPKEEERFAAKCETYDVKKQVLSMDCRVLRGAFIIKSPHFCTIVDRGKVADRFRYLVMKLVGRNLWDLRVERQGQKFSMNTSLKAAEQCLIAIEDLHRIGYLHRDIKPGNFAAGRAESREIQTIFMLDFGLCRKFVGDAKQKDLRMPRASAPFRGTTRYASIAALRQMEQSRKDDIEAWLYMIVEWTSGALPWRRLKGGDKDEVLAWKEGVRAGDGLDDFLEGCPKRQFTAIMQYLDTLVYQSIPDYNYLYYCIQHSAREYNLSPEEPLDWDTTNKYTGPAKADRDKRIELTIKEADAHDQLDDEGAPIGPTVTTTAGTNTAMGHVNNKKKAMA